MTRPSVYLALTIIFDRPRSSAALRARAGRVLAEHCERDGGCIGFGNAATWRQYVAAQERSAARPVAVVAKEAA